MSDTGSSQPPPPPPTQIPLSTQNANLIPQDQVNAIAAREKDEGKRAGQREMLEALGFNSADEAKAFFKKAKDDEKARMSETERREKEAQEAEAKAKEAEAKANAKLREANICAELQDQGVPKAQTKLVAKMVELDDSVVDDEKKISEAVAALKKAMPNLFTAQGGSATPPGSHPTPPPRGAPAPPKDAAAQARELLYERHPRLKEQAKG